MAEMQKDCLEQSLPVHNRSCASLRPRYTTTREGGSAKNAGAIFLPVHPVHKKGRLKGALYLSQDLPKTYRPEPREPVNSG